MRKRGGQIKHGLSKSPEYRTWVNMKRRCEYEALPVFSYYGGRGIKVCERWSKFENFLADMGYRPNGMSLDRIDNEGDYSPDNCRWATRKQQSRNTRTVKLIKYLDIERPLGDWAETYGLTVVCLRTRLLRGWDIERALTKKMQDRTR